MGKDEESEPRIPDGTLVATKSEEGDIRYGRIESFDGKKYAIVLPVYEAFRCCGKVQPTDTFEEIRTKRVKKLGQQTAVTLRDFDIPALNGQTAVVSKYLENGQYQCMVLTVVEGFAGSQVTVHSKNLLPVIKRCDCEKTLSPRSLKRKRQVPTEPLTSVEDSEKAWKRFAEGTKTLGTLLTMDDIPWPDNPGAPPAERYALLQKQLRADDLDGSVLKLLRKRFHPDRFMQCFGRKLEEGCTDAVRERVTEISMFMNRDVETVGRWRRKTEGGFVPGETKHCAATPADTPKAES